MTSKEIVKRVIHHDAPPRLAWDFQDKNYNDIQYAGVISLATREDGRFDEFGEYDELRRRCGFHGEMRLDAYGNIYGRLGGKTKGECVLGALERDWEALDSYSFPEISMDAVERAKAQNLRASDKYVLTGMPAGVFSTLRDLRKMDNALMDTVAEPEMLEAYMAKFTPYVVRMAELSCEAGVDGIIFYDDWGMQFSPFISPKAFREIFKPVYRRIADVCHERGVDLLLHSCGCVLPLMDDMVDADIDVFQFDQPEAAGTTLWAEQYSSRVAFYCPVDIQKIMPTGDRELIERSALHMAEIFKKHGGALIAKDYPSWGDIDVKTEWADWARKVIIDNSAM